MTPDLRSSISESELFRGYGVTPQQIRAVYDPMVKAAHLQKPAGEPTRKLKEFCKAIYCGPIDGLISQL